MHRVERHASGWPNLSCRNAPLYRYLSTPHLFFVAIENPWFSGCQSVNNKFTRLLKYSYLLSGLRMRKCASDLWSSTCLLFWGKVPVPGSKYDVMPCHITHRARSTMWLEQASFSLRWPVHFCLSAIPALALSRAAALSRKFELGRSIENATTEPRCPCNTNFAIFLVTRVSGDIFLLDLVIPRQLDLDRVHLIPSFVVAPGRDIPQSRWGNSFGWSCSTSSPTRDTTHCCLVTPTSPRSSAPMALESPTRKFHRVLSPPPLIARCGR